jgi:hypothetical protein
VAKKKAQGTREGRRARAFAIGAPFGNMDPERLAEYQDALGRKVRALVRDQPYLALGGAFASGFILGGGFRSRLGRLMLLTAGRYAVVWAAERYMER